MRVSEGMKFGKLTVTHIRSSPPESKDKSRICDCLCECGNTHSVRARELNSGNTKSCGCAKTLLKVDLTGTAQKALSYIGEADKKSGHRRIQCKCACGNIMVTTYHNYVTGRASSCGCIKRQVDSQRFDRINSSEELTAKRKKSLELYMKRKQK